MPTTPVRHQPPLDFAHQQRLRRLERRFSAYRRARRSRTRIPSALRAAVLDALASGVPASRVRTVCGVTCMQLAKWRRTQTRSASTQTGDLVPPRVLAVVDELTSDSNASTRSTAAGAASGAELAIDLHVGPMRLRLALDAQTLARLAAVGQGS